jgi:hypothetical protein
MTQERLRELLRERVADETMPDFSGRAWQAARVVRRRRRLGAAAGLVAATVGISAGIAAVESTPPAPPTDQGISDASDHPDTSPDATYQDVPVWWSPDQDEELALPMTDGPLPVDLDLGAAVTGDVHMSTAVAAFARGETVVLVPPGGGTLLQVDISRLQKITKPNGYSYLPTSTGMLTSDGQRLVFPQRGQTFALYRIATGEWSTAETFSDNADAAPPDPGFDASAAQVYGENLDGAQSFGMGVPLPVRDPAAYVSDPEFLSARGSVLAFMERFTDGMDGRYKNCCPVAGWLDDDTVVYESRQRTSRLVSWRVGTHDFGLVSRIHGAYDVASFAL